MISLKPSLSSPSRFSSGTNTSAKAIVAVSEACQPSLCSAEDCDALAAIDDQKRDAVMAALGVVLTAVTMKSARTPLVM